MRDKKGRFVKGHSFTKEMLEKNRQTHLGKPSGMKGKHQTEEAKEKNRVAHLGKTAWNKGLKGFNAGVNHPFYGKKRPEVSGEKSNFWIDGRI